jgi:DNA-binding GntR family transcriptional regulator
MHRATAGQGETRSPISRSSLAQQVTDLLRQRIYDRVLEPGARLEEAALARDLEVSRTPVREALRLLAAQGLVEMEPRRGCTVAALTVKDQREIFPIMARLEGWVAHQVATTASNEDMARVEVLHAELERHAAAGDTDRYWEANYVFHVALQELAGNRWLQSILEELRRKLNLARHRSLKLPGRLDGSLAEHRALLKALRRRDGDRAEALMRAHLMSQLEALLELDRIHRRSTSPRRNRAPEAPPRRPSPPPRRPRAGTR